MDESKSFVRKYVYNGENVFAEFNGNNQVVAKYTYSPINQDDILEANITDDGVQSGLAQYAGKYQYLKDVLGTITDVMDSNGNILQRYDYTTFGKIRTIKDSSGNDISANPLVNTSFTFTGKEYDSEVGLYYYRARYYDANIGRFLQQDPNPGILSLPITAVNKYVYASNSPTVFRDPTGRDFFSDAFRFVGDVILTAIAIYVTIFDIAIGTVGAILGLREFPKLHIEEDGWTVENSFFADAFDSASWGPAIFLSSENEYGGETWKHEYGHRLQYQEWGGWGYMNFMVERLEQRLSNTSNPDMEMDADKRATDYFGQPICGYPSPKHPVPQCRSL